MTNIGFGRSKIPLWFSPRFVNLNLLHCCIAMIAMLALLSVTFATAAPPTRDWPQWGRSPSFTSFNPVHDTIAAVAAKEWTFTAGDRVVGSPAVYAGRVWFGSDDGHMYVDEREREEESN